MTCRSAISWTPALHRMMTVPVASRPLLPALPAIWMYSPERIVEKHKRDIKILLFSSTAIHPLRWKSIINVAPDKRDGAETESSKPGSRFLKPVPSCFRMLSNTTVLAGMFTPIANVSVANSTWVMKGWYKTYLYILSCMLSFSIYLICDRRSHIIWYKTRVV